MHAIDLIVNDLSMHVYILNLVIFNQKVFFSNKITSLWWHMQDFRGLN